MTSNELELYIALGRSAGCPDDQMLNFASVGIILQERQLLAGAVARHCDHKEGPSMLGYGGARCGGKTHWLIAQMGGDDCQRYPGLKCLLLRKVGKSNLESFGDLRRRIFRRLPHFFSVSNKELTFANSSVIRCGHYQHESDIDSYLGLEYDIIGVEEATTLTHRKFLDISTCCRTSKPNWRPRVYTTTNPGGVGHAWYKKLFIDPYHAGSRRSNGVPAIEGGDPQRQDSSGAPDAPRAAQGGRGTEDEGQTPSSAFQSSSLHSSMCTPTLSDTAFIPASITDNRFIDSGYVRRLERLSGWQRRAWLFGDWDIAAGQFFTNFRRDIHVLSKFDESRAVEWFGALDYGFKHYTVFLLACKDGDGDIYIVDEHAERRLLPEQHSCSMRQLLTRHMLHPESLRWIAAGTDCFSTQHDGFTIEHQYKKHGFKLRPANTDRINGWAQMLRLFGDPDRGIKPRLFIHERCARLIECIPCLQHDPHRPEDVLKVDVDDETGEGGDDTADACRYIVNYKPAVCKVVKLQGW